MDFTSIFTINPFQVFFWQVVIIILHMTFWVITPFKVSSETTLLMLMCLHSGEHAPNTL